MNVSWSELRPKVLVLSIVLALSFASAFLFIPSPPEVSLSVLNTEFDAEPIPDFASILNIQKKKETFFDFLQPYINAENEGILQNRREIQSLYTKTQSAFDLSTKERAFISTISEEYEINTLDSLSSSHFQKLLRRVDIIPSSLVLAQAANESAWGSSRFAVEGNNFFGQWCYTQGCGIVPKARGENARYEVKRFRTVAESVNAYFMNINTFPSYEKLRSIRVQLREQGKGIDGISLTEGLDSYSERGEAYIDELQSMIYSNALSDRDQA